MKTITLDQSLFYPVAGDFEQHFEKQCEHLLLLLDALVECNRRDLRAGRAFSERALAPDILDEENRAIWRCAELREQGISAKPYLTRQKASDGSGMRYRLSVLLPDGTIEG